MTFHSTPMSSSQLNTAEGFFATLTRRKLKRDVFCTLVDLQIAIDRFITGHNATEANPLIWRANPDKAVGARSRGFQPLESIR